MSCLRFCDRICNMGGKSERKGAEDEEGGQNRRVWVREGMRGSRGRWKKTKEENTVLSTNRRRRQGSLQRQIKPERGANRAVGTSGPCWRGFRRLQFCKHSHTSKYSYSLFTLSYCKNISTSTWWLCKNPSQLAQ